MGQTTSASFSSSAESSSTDHRWKYDLFLSFRGRDTRKSIVSELYYRLQNTRGIETFIDSERLEVGDAISPTLLRTIEESRFAIVVLSENYATSPWCLEELTKICQCMQDDKRILPLFYNVNPTDVRHQKGSFKNAFTEHEKSGRHKSEKVHRWRNALYKVANFSGWNTQDYKTDRELVDAIVEVVCRKVRHAAIPSTGDFEEFEATKQAMDSVMEALKDDEITTVGVYGMGGVGKTALVTHVSQKAQNQGLFDHVIKVVITQALNLKKIQGMLADQLGIKLMEETEEGRASRLISEIMRRHKILIILDDVWKMAELSSIGVPGYKELQKCNSKVLLTTRIGNVCHVMKCQKKITLNILSKKDSWTLFERNARRSFESVGFEDVARTVAGECCGLPIALIAVARALGDKDFVEWEKAAERLKKSQTANLDDNGDVSECIKLSYDYLKDKDFKSCLLLCCLFPEDYDIPMEDLFKYAIGKGLFEGADTIQEARGQAESVATHLKDSSLLGWGKNGCVRMHDVIRDTAMAIALSEDGYGFLVKAGFGLKSWPKTNSHKHYSSISLMKNAIRKLPEELVCPKLQILLLQDSDELNEIPETFFASLNELRVLDLSNTSISSLPQSFSLLTNLQALYLDFCDKIIDISKLGKLKKLEILSIREYPLKELSREIGQLTNLRMLDISANCNGCMVRIPSKVISKLQRLEELYMRCGFMDWGRKVLGEGEEANVGLDELTSLSDLNILEVYISDPKCIPEKIKSEPNWVYFDIHIGKDRGIGLRTFQVVHIHSRSLILETTISALPPWFVNVVTSKTEKLRYVNCKGLNNILVEYDHGRLHGLKHLFISRHNDKLKELMNAITLVPNKPVFENLIGLHLDSVDSLKELCVGELPPGSLFNLKLLTIHHCHNLEKVLLPSKLLQRLSNLEILTCWEMNGMAYVFGCDGFEPEQSRLRELTFYNLSSVISICNGSAPRAMFRTLKSLSIVKCNFRGSLFTADVAHYLLQLESLFVVNCSFLERVIEARQETVNKKKIVLPKLKSLVLEKLPMLYMSGSGTIDIQCPLLEYMYVKECPQFSATATDFQSKNQVQLLDRLPYIDLLLSRFVDNNDPWGDQSTIFNTYVWAEKFKISVKKALPGIIEKRPDFMDRKFGSTENMHILDDAKILLESVPELKEITLTIGKENALAIIEHAIMTPELRYKASKLKEKMNSMTMTSEYKMPTMEIMHDLFELIRVGVEMMPELTSDNIAASSQMGTRWKKGIFELLKRTPVEWNKENTPALFRMMPDWLPISEPMKTSQNMPEEVEIRSQVKFASMLKSLFENTEFQDRLSKNNKTSQNMPEEGDVVSCLSLLINLVLVGCLFLICNYGLSR